MRLRLISVACCRGIFSDLREEEAESRMWEKTLREEFSRLWVDVPNSGTSRFQR